MRDPGSGRFRLLAGALGRLEDALLVALLGVLLLLASTQILLRNLFDAGLTWADPLLRVLVLWLGLLGARVSRPRQRILSASSRRWGWK